MPDITIRDCGPGDGLQPLAPVEPEVRAALARRLAACGVAHVEAVSFVSPTAVPAMARPVEGLEQLDGGANWWALVPNVRGAELALQAGVGQLTVTVSASETCSLKNTRRTVAEAVEGFAAIRSLSPDLVLDAVVSCCFGSPFAPGAGSNLATEDLVALMKDIGNSTGIGLNGLLEAGRWLTEQIGLALPSRVAAAGPLDPRA
jgi:hydroxymethylglutaryl-CoA lyase